VLNPVDDMDGMDWEDVWNLLSLVVEELWIYWFF